MIAIILRAASLQHVLGPLKPNLKKVFHFYLALRLLLDLKISSELRRIDFYLVDLLSISIQSWDPNCILSSASNTGNTNTIVLIITTIHASVKLSQLYEYFPF